MNDKEVQALREEAEHLRSKIKVSCLEQQLCVSSLVTNRE